MMDTIGVVPHDPEIRRTGFHRGEPADRSVRIGDSVGIRVHRHAPDALHRRIGGIPLHLVHVRAVRSHGHGNQFKAEILRNPEVPVIARSRTEKFHLFLPAPGRAAVNAVGIGHRYVIKHHVQAGIPADNHLGGVHAQHIGEHRLRLRNPVQQAVIPRIHPGIRAVPVPGIDAIQKTQRKIQLLGTRFAAGHIQLQPLSPGVLIQGTKLFGAGR